MPSRVSAAAAAAFFTLLALGCSSIDYTLPGHSRAERSHEVRLSAGERRLALTASARLPAPGGFELTLVSEDDTIARVERVPGPAGSAKTYLIGRQPGQTTLHYANHHAFRRVYPEDHEMVTALRAESLGSFTVIVSP